MNKAPQGRAGKSKLPRLIQKYRADLADLSHQHVMYEMGMRPAFHALLGAAGKEHGWTLIAEHEKKVNGRTIRPDGTFKDAMNLVRGYWEAKDTADNLETEITKKTRAGYPPATSSSKTPPAPFSIRMASASCPPTWPIPPRWPTC